MLKISVITINYNNAVGLKRTLQSVINQKYDAFEYIIIDGGSRDESTEIIKQYANRLSYWISESDKGIYNAMNKGIAKANGEYLLFLNSGDELLADDSLLNISSYLNVEDLIYTNLIVRNQQSDYTKKYPDQLTFSYFIDESLPHPATFIRRNLFERFGFYNEALKICSDWEFFINCICRYNVSYKHIDTVLSVFYFDGISSSPEYAQMVRAEKNSILKKDFQLFTDVWTELKEAKEFKKHLKQSRLIKLARKIGFLKQLFKKD